MYQSISKKHIHTHGQLSNASSLSKEKLLYARCTTSPSHINVVPCADPHVGSTFMWFLTVYPQNFQPKTIHCSRQVGPSGINRWLREFFQSASTRTRIGEHTQLSLGQAL